MSKPRKKEERPVLLIKIGQHLKELRLNKGYSQEHLANLAGVYRNYIGMIERAEYNPTIVIVYQICIALNISLKEFFAEI